VDVKDEYSLGSYSRNADDTRNSAGSAIRESADDGERECNA
jgi:hypothetical protein